MQDKPPGVVDNGAIITLNSERVIAYRPEIAKYFGDQPNIAIYFQQLYHWQQFAGRKDGYFYKSAQEIYEETSISPKRQRKCREELESEGWIVTKKEMANGHPTIHFRVIRTLQTAVSPLGEKTNGNSQKDKSITREDNTKENILSNLTDDQKAEMDKIYKLWLIHMVVDPEIRLHGDADSRSAALKAATTSYRFTDKRRIAVARRLNDAGYEMLVRAIKNLGQSSWHRGNNERGWKADIADFLCRSYEKVEDWSNKSSKPEELYD